MIGQLNAPSGQDAVAKNPVQIGDDTPGTGERHIHGEGV